MRPSVFPRPRLLLHALLVAACLAGCPAGPPPTPDVPTPSPTPSEPAPSASPTPALRPGAPLDSPVLVFGDDVTAKAFRQLDGWAEAFAPEIAPPVQGRGEAELSALGAEARIQAVLREFPEAKRVGLAFGGVDARSSRANFADFTVSILNLANAVLADGRQPLIARIPWSPLERMAAAPSLNVAIGLVEAELGLAPGPDLHAWFAAHPEQLAADGLTPTADGEAAIRRLWADALKRGHALPAPTTRPAFAPSPDVFLAYGDSITYLSFVSTDDWSGLFPGAVAPAIRNFGSSGATTGGGLTRLPSALALNPDAGFVGIAFGTNDIALRSGDVNVFKANMRAMATRARDAGRTPLLARIAFRTRPPLPEIPYYNAQIAAIEQELGLPPGPDFFTWFEAHRDEISADGVHPTDAGKASVRRLWSEALARARSR